MLERLDAQAATWPRIGRWPYLGLRWFLILMGVYLVIGLAGREIAGHRIGLGTGVLTMLLLAGVKGVGIALGQVTASRPPAH